MFRTTLIVFGLTCSALPALAETTWTRTGPNGGTAQGQVACNVAQGTTTCTGASTYTSPEGRVSTRRSTRIGTPDQVTMTATGTGPRGKTVTTTRIRSR
jgi:hypothetical protein